MLLHEIFEVTARKRPHKEALVLEGRRLSYAELDAWATRVAALMQARGVHRGDRVATLLDNSFEAVVTYLAVLKIGAVLMPVSPLTRSEKLAFLLNDARASVLVTHGSLATTYDAALTHAHTVHTCVVAQGLVDEARRIAFPGRGARVALDSPGTIDLDLAAIVYTSGSTGTPKGVMLTHANLVSATRSITEYLGVTAEDRLMCVLPLAFNYGLSQLLVAFATGASVVLERSFAFPVRVLQTMVEERVTVFAGVPTVFALMVNVKSLGEFDLSSLRLLTNAGAALPVQHVRRIRELLPHARLLLMYGQTECVRVTYLDADEVDRRPDSVGRGMPNQEHWLVDEEGRRLPLGSAGELVVRGAHVMRGYWERPDETIRRLKAGTLPGEVVLHTGDLFRTDDEGYLYFIGRTDDIIKSRGEKVSPREVENTLYALPGVLEAAVVGVPDPVLGQAVRAFLVLTDGARYSPREVIRHCQARLESYMVPQDVVFVAALPKTDSGKIRKKELV